MYGSQLNECCVYGSTNTRKQSRCRKRINLFDDNFPSSIVICKHAIVSFLTHWPNVATDKRAESACLLICTTISLLYRRTISEWAANIPSTRRKEDSQKRLVGGSQVTLSWARNKAVSLELYTCIQALCTRRQTLLADNTCKKIFIKKSL